MEGLDRQLELAEDYYDKGDRARARQLLDTIANVPLEADNADGIRVKEQAIYRLGELLMMSGDGDSLIKLLSTIRPFFVLLPKAKTTKLVRKLFECIVQCGVSLDRQHEVCLSTIEWARSERRTFLRHRLQLRLVEVLFEKKDTRNALHTLLALLREVRRLDDRTLLLDIHLLESKIYYSIRNLGKARAALVSARTTANSIYCPPLAQAEIDLQSGVLHAEEHDAKTAYSYLYEAFEGFHQLGDQARQARRALRYMILAKIATNMPDELAAVLASKNVLEYKGDDMDALRGIAEAHGRQDTHLFNAVLRRQRAAGEAGILHDEVIQRQLDDMYDTLMERHLLRIVEPYNRVQISYLASLLQLDAGLVEGRVSQLILDKKLSGIVDQQHNCLIVFDDKEKDKQQKATFFENAADQAANEEAHKTTLHQDALTALEAYNTLVTALFDKVSGKFDALVEENLAKRRPQSSGEEGKKKKDKDGGAAAPGEDNKEGEKSKSKSASGGDGPSSATSAAKKKGSDGAAGGGDAKGTGGAKKPK